MCSIKTPNYSTTQAEKYKESAQAQQPDNAAALTAAGRRAADRVRAGSSTVLTSGNGVLKQADTQKSVLLGA
ncbi:MAG: hypothetical protein HC900_00075 [Methylacidiphilales bacterium]|nr:hypothetical protein [Candidatus Methylacidiphilales bacterium]